MQNLNKRIWVYTFFVMWLFPQWVMAEEVQKLVISKYDGTEVSFLLSEKPKIVFSLREDGFYDLMNVKTKDVSIELATYDLDKMMIISVDPTNIDNIASTSESMFTWNEDALCIEILKDNTTITVYNTEGKIILSKNLGIGKHALSFSDLPKGMNIIKINDETIKIWNR